MIVLLLAPASVGCEDLSRSSYGIGRSVHHLMNLLLIILETAGPTCPSPLGRFSFFLYRDLGGRRKPFGMI